MEIEKGLRIPKVKRYPFADMEVGDSMLFDELSEVESAQNAGYSYSKTHDNRFKMTRRKMDNGYRLWRIA